MNQAVFGMYRHASTSMVEEEEVKSVTTVGVLLLPNTKHLVNIAIDV